MSHHHARAGRAFACSLLLVFACKPADADPSEHSETTDTSGDGDGEMMWPAPDNCETRQLQPSGALAGPTDLQPRCDPNPPGSLIALHRPESVACETDPAPIEPCVDPGGECQYDVDCEAIAAGGRCASFDGLGGLCSCVLPCSTDDDCPSDRACVCRSALFNNDDTHRIVSHSGCWPASCRTDADCGADEECGMATNSCGPRSLACRGPSDVCQSDLDCSDYDNCMPAVDGESWSCVDNSSCQ